MKNQTKNIAILLLAIFIFSTASYAQLCLTFISFTATKNGNCTVDLAWTYNQCSTGKYYVMYSKGGGIFYPIAVVNSNLNINSEESYTYSDTYACPGDGTNSILYYIRFVSDATGAGYNSVQRNITGWSSCDCTTENPSRCNGISGVSILGDNSICFNNSENYTLSASHPVTWSIPTGSSLVTVASSSFNDITLTNNSSNGTAVLNANIMGCLNIQKSIYLANSAPVIEFVSFSNPNGSEYEWCSDWYGNQFDITCTDPYIYADWEVRTFPGMSLVYSGQSGFTGYVGYMPPDFYIFKARPTGSCGVGGWYETEIGNFECDPGTRMQLSVSPNPAQNDLYVTIKEPRSRKSNVVKPEKVVYQLYNLNKTTLVRQWVLDNSVNQRKLNVHDLMPGYYILSVIKGNIRQSKMVILK